MMREREEERGVTFTGVFSEIQPIVFYQLKWRLLLEVGTALNQESSRPHSCPTVTINL